MFYQITLIFWVYLQPPSTLMITSHAFSLRRDCFTLILPRTLHSSGVQTLPSSDWCCYPISSSFLKTLNSDSSNTRLYQPLTLIAFITAKLLIPSHVLIFKSWLTVIPSTVWITVLSDFINVWSVLPMGFPGGASGKECTYQCRRHKRCGFHPPVRKISWRRAWQPSPICLPGEFHGQRSQEGSGPWNPSVRHDRGNLAKHILPITWSLSTLTFFPLKTLPFVTL